MGIGESYTLMKQLLRYNFQNVNLISLFSKYLHRITNNIKMMIGDLASIFVVVFVNSQDEIYYK